MMSNFQVDKNKSSQTNIHVQPHFLSSNEKASVRCNRYSQTAVTALPLTENTNILCDLLEFIPYQDIEEESERELELPRKVRLQWKLPNDQNDYEISSTSKAFSSDSFKNRKKIADQETQTNISVVPHILENDKVANVFVEIPVQTSFTFTPEESLTSVISQLKKSSNTSFTPIFKEINLLPNIEEDKYRKIVDGRIKNVIDTTVSVLQKELIKMVHLQNIYKQGCKCENSHLCVCVQNFAERNNIPIKESARISSEPIILREKVSRCEESDEEKKSYNQ